MRDEAQSRATEAVANLDAEARWNLVIQRIKDQRRLTREVRIRTLELEALRELICPEKTSAEWADLWYQYGGEEVGESPSS
jgi:hypothetical protein